MRVSLVAASTSSVSMWWTLVCVVAAGVCGASTEQVQYTGAVLEYKPYSSWEGGGLAILEENARIFLEYAALASQQGADIMVFPEYGLTSTNLGGGDVLALSQVVPRPADLVVPCNLNHTNDNTRVLGVLSCGAAELGMYLVVDLTEAAPCQPQHRDCPDPGYFLYNTQVVLDRSGTVMARYRKKHLFLEPEYTPGTEDDDTALFTTDFGVTFSLQVCFDIMFESPGVANVENGVRDVAMSTAWIDGLPFLTALQIFRGWSAGLGVNLLVANYHNPLKGMLGSGLFPASLEEGAHYTYDHEGGNTLLVSPLTTAVSSSRLVNDSDPSGRAAEPRPEEQRGLRERDMVFIHENLTEYNHLLLDQQEDGTPVTASLCHNDSLCCNVTYTIPANTERVEEHHMLLAYSGVVVKGGGVYPMFTQVCAVVFCLDDNVNSCAFIEGEEPPLRSSILVQELSGVFQAQRVFPSLFLRDLSLPPEHFWDHYCSPWNGGHHQCRVRVSGDPGPVLSLTMMGRWYFRDP